MSDLVRDVDLEPLEHEEAQELVGLAIEEWDGACHGVSLALAPRLGGVVRRGLFLGETKPGAVFHQRPCQHSWIELSDGSVCDPTRHAFDLSPRWPLWVGPADEYDIGACRSTGPAGHAPDFLESEHDPVLLECPEAEYIAQLVGAWQDNYGGEDEDLWVLLSIEQVFWLANLPVKDEERPGVLSRFFAGGVYEALVAAGQRAAIPVDRRHWILGEDS